MSESDASGTASPPAPPRTDVATGIAEYARYVEAQLTRQEERRRSLEARGVAVITSSGTLATLLLGLIAIATKDSSFELPEGARLPLAGALVAFAVAAGFSIVTNIPRKADEASIAGLRKFISDRQEDSERVALYEVARNRLSVLESARKLDRFKGRALVLAMLAQTSALAFLAWAMIEII